MNDLQYCGIEKRYNPCITNKYLQAAFATVLLLAVVVVPVVASITFFLN